MKLRTAEIKGYVVWAPRLQVLDLKQGNKKDNHELNLKAKNEARFLTAEPQFLIEKIWLNPPKIIIYIP